MKTLFSSFLKKYQVTLTPNFKQLTLSSELKETRKQQKTNNSQDHILKGFFRSVVPALFNPLIL